MRISTAALLVVFLVASSSGAGDPARTSRWVKFLGMTGVDQFELPGSNLVSMGPEGVSALSAAAEFKGGGRPKQAWTRAYASRMEAVLALQASGKSAPVDALARIALDEGEHAAFRSSAALALGSAGGKDAAEALRKLLLDPVLKCSNPRGEVLRLQQTPTISPAGTRDYPRRAAALGMGRLGKVDRSDLPDLLWETLHEERESPQVRLAAALALAEMGEQANGGRLLELAGSLHEKCRCTKRQADLQDQRDLLLGVCLAVGTCARKEKDFGACIGVLSDPDQPAALRNAAAIAVGMAGRLEAAEKLRPHLSDPDLEVRVGTAVAMGGLLQGQDPGARKALLDILQTPKDPALKPEALALARAYAAISLGFFPAEETLEALAKWGASEEDGGIRINCANAAGHLKGLDPRPFLESRLAGAKEAETDPIIRWVLVGMLLDRDVSEATRGKILRMSCEEGDPVLREKALIKIQDFKGEDAQDAVRKAFKDASPRVRRAAALTAGAAGCGGLAPDLRKLQNDAFDTVRQAASESLACLSSGKPSEWMDSVVKGRRVHIDGSCGGEWVRMRQRMSLEVLQIGPQDLEQLENYRRDLAAYQTLADQNLQEKAAKLTEAGKGNGATALLTDQELAEARAAGRFVDYYT